MKSIYSFKAKSIVLLFVIVFISFGFKFYFEKGLTNYSETIEYCNSNKSEIINGWIKLGISQDLLIKKLNEPEIKGEDEYWGATGNYVQKWIYVKIGLTFLMESDVKAGLKKVIGISMESPCLFKTNHNLGINSSIKEVKLCYQKTIDKENSNDSIIVVGSVYSGSYFYFTKDFVSKIFIGSLAE